MSTTELPTYVDVTTRFLKQKEIPIRPGCERGPLVIEAKSSASVDFFKGFLSSHGADIKRALYTHGAILLRGFQIESDHDFATMISSIPNLRPMSDYFMSEQGRTKVNKAEKVFYTNKYYKTGGGFSLGGFHSENYYSTDVPAVVGFWCRKAPPVGGETALIQSAQAYAELDDEIRARLEERAVYAFSYAKKDIARRYHASSDDVTTWLERAGLMVHSADPERLALYKPPVFQHAETKKRSLQVNVSRELRGLDIHLRKRLLPFYAQARWALHRLGWAHGAVATALAVLELLPSLILYPPLLLEWVIYLLQGEKEDPLSGERLHSRLTPQQIEALAGALFRHCYAFSWQRNDVLIFDNLQMLHTGLPGWGARELRVILCNPIKLPYSPGPGLVEVSPESPHESLDGRLRAAYGPRASS